MPTSYELTIPFKPSKDYQRLVILLHTLALLAVLGCDYPFWISVYLTVAVLVYGWYLFKLKRPHPHQQALVCEKGEWFIEDTFGQRTKFSRLRVAYDVHYVICLVLEREKKKRYIVFFQDQLTFKERRAFYFSQLEWREPTTLFKPAEEELPE